MSLILLAALLLRLVALDQSLWLDEATTARVVQQFDLTNIISKFSINDFHPPLYYLLMDLWASLFGTSEIALRMPSVIFSLLTGWLVYLIGKKLTNEQVGLWAAVFLLFNPLIVYYSQEARMYLMVTFFLTGAVYYLLNKRYALFNLMAFLSVLTFYGSVLFIGSIYIWYLYKRDYKILAKLIAGPLAAAVVVSPLLWQQFQNSRIALAQVTNWSLVLGKSNLKNLLLIPIKFSIGRISFEPKIFYWAISGLWTLFVFIFAIKGAISEQRHSGLSRIGKFLSRFWSRFAPQNDVKQPGRFLIILFVTPLVFGFIISFWTPLLQYFRFIYLIPLLSILMALGVKKNWQKYLLTGGFVLFSLIYLLNPGFHREDWKTLVRDLPADKPVYMIDSSSDPVKYYNPGLKIIDLRQIEVSKEKEVVVIPYTADIHGFDYKSVLIKKGFKLEEEKSFREVKYERWLKQALYYSEKVSPPLN